MITKMFDFRNASLIRQYNQLRDKRNHVRFCNAPLTALRFHRNGGVQVCCHHIDYWYLHQRSLKDIWFGDEIKSMRKNMRKYRIPEACSFCAAPYYARDYTNVAALSFDYLKPNANGYPVLMDFSLENTCNLKCIMCDASLSSSIAKERNQTVKPKESFYGDDFLLQLEAFIPHLKYAVFTGGEPFLIDIYYKIWDKILSLNPVVTFNIITNGTILNRAVIDFLKKAKVNIIVSVDSFQVETYNKIRRGADLNKTLKNVYEFAGICQSKNTDFTITVCPMIINAYEIPEIVNKCNQENWNFIFNTVLKPWHQALWSLEQSKLKHLIAFYKTYHIKGDNALAINNKSKFNSLIRLLENWLEKLKQFDLKPKNSIEVIKMRNEIKEIITIALSETASEHINKVEYIIDEIPDLLIRKSFLDYVKNLSKPVIINEFVDNDQDTIIDHFCIVAFNL